VQESSSGTGSESGNDSGSNSGSNSGSDSGSNSDSGTGSSTDSDNFLPCGTVSSCIRHSFIFWRNMKKMIIMNKI